MNKAGFKIIAAGFFSVICAVLLLNFPVTKAGKMPPVEAKVLIKKDADVFINGVKISQAGGGGTSISSGSKLNTLEKDEATVIIDGVGSLQLEKRTSVILNYNESKTHVLIEEGCVTLWVEPGKNGYLKAKDEEKSIENNKRRASIANCSDKRIGGVLLWSAYGAGGAAIGTTTLLSSPVIKDPEVASASRSSDIR